MKISGRTSAVLCWLLVAAALGAACQRPAEPAAAADAPRDPPAPEARSEPAAEPAPDAGAAGIHKRRPPEQESRREEEPGDDEAARYQQAMILGDAALCSGKFEEAQRHYFEAMELNESAMSPALGALRALRPRGNADVRAGIERTIRRKVASLEATPETRGAAYLLNARLAIALGEDGEALDKARLAVAKLGEMGVAWRVLGEAAAGAELWGDAVAAYRKAASLGLQAAAGTWERLADALDELGELSRAEKAARKAIELTGADIHARRRRLNLLAVIVKHGGRPEEAEGIAKQALALGPNDPAVLHDLGAIAEALGRDDEALARYRAALAAGPNPMTSWRLGHLLLKLDQPNEAVVAFTAACAHLDRWTWPASTRWLPPYETGKLYARGGRFGDAIGWFDDALREARDARANREIRSWLSYARVRKGGTGED